MILDCEFCINAAQFPDRRSAVDAGWNWMTGVRGNDKLVTAACPDCDESKVSDRHKEKQQNLKIVKGMSAEAIKDKSQVSLND